VNQYIKERWIEELRSGKYRQGNGLLNDGEGNYCCLGVLCELAVADGVIEEPTDLPHQRGLSYDGSNALTPQLVQEWAGLRFRTPVVRWGDEYDVAVTTLNDEGVTFAEIADVLERTRTDQL
jgi:hypothetical protein